MSPKPHTLALVEALAKAIEARFVGSDIVDVRTEDLPPLNTKERDALAHSDDRVAGLAKRAQVAAGFVVATPIYHNSYSGAVKSLLDHLPIAVFEGKPVVLAGNGGSTRSTQGVDHLRLVMRGLRAVALPDQIVCQRSDFVDDGRRWRLADELMLHRVEIVAGRLVEYAGLLGG